MAKAQGLDYALLSPSEIKDKYPIMEMDDIVGGLWDAHDGDIDPSQLTQALAKGAKDLGAKVQRFNGVTAIKQQPGGEWKITTKDGTEFVAEKVINAAGYRAGEVAALVGQYLPIIAMQHQYLITEMIPELAARKEKLPLVREIAQAGDFEAVVTYGIGLRRRAVTRILTMENASRLVIDFM